MVKVFVPQLPRAAALLPYLERIDATRQYANRGPLVALFEQRLRAMLGLRHALPVMAASGTAALQAAILAHAGRATAARPLALVPAYTFAATAHAAEACGYAPCFVDCAADEWAVMPAALRGHPALARAGVVLPVAPYGRPPDQAGWAGFAAASGIPVVIDAAASVEAIARDPDTVGRVPVVISLHATKALAVGEGGAVLWSDLHGLVRVAQALNFGFLGSREVRSPGLNGKPSEYHAAVGLAGLDEWAPRAARRTAVAAMWAEAAARDGIAGRMTLPPAIASHYALFAARSGAEARAVTADLDAAGIGWRRWYGRGLHREAYFSGAGAEHAPALPHAEALGDRLIGVPMHEALTAADIAAVCATLRRAA